jgi:hypothetical protein
VDAAAMLRTAVPDLPQRTAQFKLVRMPFDAAGRATSATISFSFDETVR